MRVRTYAREGRLTAGPLADSENNRKDTVKDENLSQHVPEGIRRHFVQAFKGQYGYWFEFDGAVRFRDNGGDEFPFAYGKTVSDCRKMMERGTV